MGVLDDAIREHLDLKRRHGVAEEELRRQEEEALGPARREVAPAAIQTTANRPARHAPQPVDGHERRGAAEWHEAVERSAGSRRRRPQGFDALADEEPLHDEEELAATRKSSAEDAPAARKSSRPRRSSTRTRSLSRRRELRRGARTATHPARIPTCSRTHRTSCRRRRSTTGSGSSRSRRATSTSTEREQVGAATAPREVDAAAPPEELRRGPPAPATPALMQPSGAKRRLLTRRNPPCRR